MKTKKLGRGLGELLGEMDEVYENELSSKNSIVEIPLQNIRPNPYQPREYFDETSLYELGCSIKDNGLIQPIVVTEDIDGYIIVAGERRYRASKLMKLKTIRAVILNSNENEMRQFALIENIQRDDLNAIELAKAYSELIKLHNITHDELSNIIHKSRTQITNTIRLLQLSQKTQQALIDKKITAGHARVLVGLDEQTQLIVVNSIIGQKLSVREVENMIKSMKMEQKQISKDKIADITLDFSSIKEKFNTLGFKHKISKNKLTIEFENNSQINDFLNFLS
jgi:ParB family chromosome partitioning protein